jgi:hypothetical protein
LLSSVAFANICQLAIPNAEKWSGLDFGGLCKGGEQMAVSDDNKHKYVQYKVEEILINSRKAELDVSETRW